MLLEKKGKTLPPEVMFVMVVIGVYAPVVFSAVQERQRKNKQAQAEEEQKQQAQVIKKKGRPKGSKDSKPRKPKTITIKQNKNESD
jgi:Tfp pilus assembly major pilin PilA